MKTFLSFKKFKLFFLAVTILLAGLGFTTPAVAQASCSATYTIQRGDYLMKIARTCGVSYSDLLKANPTITNPSLTFPGQVLNIPVRILFGAGDTSSIVQGQLAANTKLVYLLNAAAGQTLEATLSGPARLNLAVLGADGSTLQSAGVSQSFRGVLPKTQDYLLVLSSGSSAATYGLSVEIPLRIHFAAGGTSATLTGTVPAALSQVFILGAAKGQTLTVTATPDDKLQMIIYGVDGSVLRSGMGQGASFSGVLPSTQDYILALRSANQVQAFNMKVSIPGPGPVPVPGSLSYTVQKGDTLFGIALRYQTTVNTLLRANPEIANMNVIPVGQVIYLPGATLSLSDGKMVYIAKRGDILAMIARKFNTTLGLLISANPQISNPNLIFPGQRINLP